MDIKVFTSKTEWKKYSTFGNQIANVFTHMIVKPSFHALDDPGNNNKRSYSPYKSTAGSPSRTHQSKKRVVRSNTNEATQNTAPTSPESTAGMSEEAI